MSRRRAASRRDAAPLHGRRRDRLSCGLASRRYVGPSGEPAAVEDVRQRPRRWHRLCPDHSRIPNHLAMDPTRSPAMKSATSLVAVLLGVVALTAGCAQLESDKAPPTTSTSAPAIAATGPHAVSIGSSITITATTTNGSDSAYTFATANPGVATVDGQGAVTGIAVGETSITVTGVTTKAVASYPVVVVAPDDTAQIPYYDRWRMSAHADGTALAFNNWNQAGSV